tara:strand:- start:25091 stop:26542 length:1452 start_codon:yes stop_codon:yes gene_type:complete
MKIIFVIPKTSDFDPEFMLEPLHIGYMSSYLKSKGYNDLELIYGAFTNDEETIERCSKADIVGLNTTSPMLKHAVQLAEEIKKRNSNVVTMIGGAHASALPIETLTQCKPIDIIARGEAEETLLSIVKALENKTDFKDIRGITYRDKSGEIIHNEDVILMEDLDQLPFPDREFINQDLFIKRNLKTGKKTAWMVSSRGCPFTCSFCASHIVWTRKWRPRSPENLLKEMKELKAKYKVDHINFADDTLTIDKQRMFDFCRMLKAANLNITWGGNSQTSTVNKELLQAMAEAGCVELWFGVESGSQQILKNIKKNIILQHAKDAFKWCHEVGIKTTAYMMIGSEGESYETIKESEALLDEIKSDVIAWMMNTPFPGGDEYRKAIEKGHIQEDTDWSKVEYHYTSLVPTEHLTCDEIVKEHSRLVKKYENQKDYNFHFKYMPEYLLYRLKTAKLSDYPILFNKLFAHLKKFDVRKSLSDKKVTYEA